MQKRLGLGAGFLLVFASSSLVGCSSTRRVLVVRSQPAEAEVCIKGKPGSQLISTYQQCVGSTPFEAERLVLKNPKGKKVSINLGDFEDEGENFDIVVRRPGYAPQTVSVPDWEHEFALKPGTPARAAVIQPRPIALPAQPAPSIEVVAEKVAPAAEEEAQNRIESQIADRAKEQAKEQAKKQIAEPVKKLEKAAAPAKQAVAQRMERAPASIPELPKVPELPAKQLEAPKLGLQAPGLESTAGPKIGKVAPQSAPQAQIQPGAQAVNQPQSVVQAASQDL